VILSLSILGIATVVYVVRRPLMMSVSAPGGLEPLPVTGARPVRGRTPMSMSEGWQGLFVTFNGVVLITLIALPLAALVVWALARRRGAAGITSAWRRSLAEVGMVFGTVPFVWMTLIPGARAGTVPGRVSLAPLHDLPTMGPVGILGNLLIFAALAFFAPMRFAVLASVPRILALGAGCSVLVETAQYVLRLDRVSSVDDVLVNTTGAVLAALASRPWWRTTREARSDQPRPAPAPAG
jgi:glycopeptide antibiotics resistance protein